MLRFLCPQMTAARHSSASSGSHHARIIREMPSGALELRALEVGGLNRCPWGSGTQQVSFSGWRVPVCDYFPPQALSQSQEGIILICDCCRNTVKSVLQDTESLNPGGGIQGKGSQLHHTTTKQQDQTYRCYGRARTILPAPSPACSGIWQ